MDSTMVTFIHNSTPSGALSPGFHIVKTKNGIHSPQAIESRALWGLSAHHPVGSTSGSLPVAGDREQSQLL